MIFILAVVISMVLSPMTYEYVPYVSECDCEYEAVTRTKTKST